MIESFEMAGNRFQHSAYKNLYYYKTYEDI